MHVFQTLGYCKNKHLLIVANLKSRYIRLCIEVQYKLQYNRIKLLKCNIKEKSLFELMSHLRSEWEGRKV